jgi:toxin ParE1/3/4
MHVRLTTPAESELTEAVLWYNDIRDELASRLVVEFQAVIERLRDNPYQFPRLRHDIRRAGFRRFPYGLIYRIHPNEVEVIACFHDRRNPADWQRRM